MTNGVRRTADGIELTRRLAGLGVTFMALIGGVAGFALNSARKSDRLEHAVQQQEFRDTTSAIRADLREVMHESRETRQRLLSLNCYQAAYPVGLCDDVPRRTSTGSSSIRPIDSIVVAGSPRGHP